ncbi:hypothetical protein F8M41_018719 [Gigaspora margarita]|uniref:Uncharacterized protein n=1 Tax=Gigaspora margarita TaxID=4874 RepID=A0A8H4AL30_GIGMA|nr:hypothetical protein F8M41_018719 [Gigaspora margarita]
MNTIIGTNKDNKVVKKVRAHIQRTSYKVSKKLNIIQETKKIASNRCIGARRVSFYLAAKEELVKWLNDLHQTEIAITVAVIKMQMVTIFLTTCASKYPDATNPSFISF